MAWSKNAIQKLTKIDTLLPKILIFDEFNDRKSSDEGFRQFY